MMEKVNEGNDRYIALMRERERRNQPEEEILSDWLTVQLEHERSWRQQVEEELIALSIETALAWEQLEIEGISTQQMLREAIIELKNKLNKEPSCETTPSTAEEDSLTNSDSSP